MYIITTVSEISGKDLLKIESTTLIILIGMSPNIMQIQGMSRMIPPNKFTLPVGEPVSLFMINLTSSVNPEGISLKTKLLISLNSFFMEN